MPEGDVLFRTAATLQRWLAGRQVTEVSTGGPFSKPGDAAAARLVGSSVDRVTANGKHLLVHFDSGHVLHTHLRMTGSWHVYRSGEPWRRPERQARLTLTCGDRQAVCFNTPVLEILRPGAVDAHPALTRLGPDILADPPDIDGMVSQARRRPASTALGELLLDQTVAAGIGNIWRCEALFAAGLHPGRPLSAVSDEVLARLFGGAARLMQASVTGGGRPEVPAVYERAGRPCRRCRTLIEARRQGKDARTAYWCPRCQPAAP